MDNKLLTALLTAIAVSPILIVTLTQYTLHFEGDSNDRNEDVGGFVDGSVLFLDRPKGRSLRLFRGGRGLGRRFFQVAF